MSYVVRNTSSSDQPIPSQKRIVCPNGEPSYPSNSISISKIEMPSSPSSPSVQHKKSDINLKISLNGNNLYIYGTPLTEKDLSGIYSLTQNAPTVQGSPCQTTRNVTSAPKTPYCAWFPITIPNLMVLGKDGKTSPSFTKQCLYYKDVKLGQYVVPSRVLIFFDEDGQNVTLYISNCSFGTISTTHELYYVFMNSPYANKTYFPHKKIPLTEFALTSGAPGTGTNSNQCYYVKSISDIQLPPVIPCEPGSKGCPFVDPSCPPPPPERPPCDLSGTTISPCSLGSCGSSLARGKKCELECPHGETGNSYISCGSGGGIFVNCDCSPGSGKKKKPHSKPNGKKKKPSSLSPPSLSVVAIVGIVTGILFVIALIGYFMFGG